MRTSAEFRAIAREKLNNNWLIAVFAGLIVSILGGIDTNKPGITFHIDELGPYFDLEIAGHTIFSTNSPATYLLLGGITYAIIISIIISIAFFIIGSILQVGYAKFNLNLIDGKTPSINTLIDYLSYWKTMVLTSLLQFIYVTLWSLLLIIPGIIATYNYAMTKYILAENPELTPNEAITQSKEMMYGHRLRFFILQLSFIGWNILAYLTLGIGYLFLTPYKEAAYAAFYREISYTEKNNYKENNDFYK